ncbi:MAG: T9SS type A sorting domain-containing protein, partial [Sphingobacteriales bacterium]
ICGVSVPLFQATFYIDPAVASNYNWTTPSDTTYIAEFNDGTTDPTSSHRDILFISSRPFDQAGNGNVNCPDGSMVPGINTLPDDKAPNIFYNTNAPLPVNLKYFEAYKQNNNVSLQWETAGELSGKGFEVQRKTGKGFETIGFVPSKSAGGYSEQNLSYNFIDPNITNGTIYYRLKQLSYLAEESYSEIKAIRNSKMLQVLIYPNPGNGKVNIIVPVDVRSLEVRIVNSLGRTIKIWNNINGNLLEINNLSKGFYLVKSTNLETGESFAQKLTVL